MADNFITDAGAGGNTYASDDVAGVHYPILKLAFGALDTAVLAIAGAGAVTTGTQRTTLASDDPAVTALQIMDDWDNAASDGATVSGDVAHDGVDAGEPVKVGGRAQATAPTAVSLDGDRVNAWFLLNGAQATVVTAAGALIGGDAANGLDVDVTRLPALVAGSANIGDVDVLTVPAPLSTTGGGTEATALRVTLASDSTGLVSIDDNGGSLTVDGTVAVTNGGTFATQVDGAALTALQKIDDPVLVDDAAFTPATSSVMMAGFEADETATDSVDEGDAGAARMTLTRKLITNPQPHTSGGLTLFKSIDIDETEEEIKATAGQVYNIAAFNHTAAPLYLKFYNATAATVIVGTTVPDLTFTVPGNADSDGAGFISNSVYGWAFGTAITVAATTAIADADAGAPAVNACSVMVGYI